MEPRSHGLKPLDNLASLFKARRSLLEPVGCLPPPDSGLTIESLDFLISLYRSQRCGWRELKTDAECFVSFKSLERLLVNSQPHISRRVRELSRRGLVDVTRPGKGRFHGNSRIVRLNACGISVTEPVWIRYRRLGEHFLDGVSAQDRQAHYEVNKIIRERIRSMCIEPLAERETLHPVENLLKIFETTRDLFSALEDHVLADSDLTPERADILLMLYRYRTGELGNPETEGEMHEGGFVTAHKLRLSLVFTQTLDETLVFRRLTDFVADKFVELKKDKPPVNQKTFVRITPKGAAVAKAIWEKYTRLADRLLENIRPHCPEAHYRVNETISDRIRPSWETVLKNWK